MKSKKITLIGAGALFFVAAGQMIGCGGGSKPAPKQEYKVSINSNQTLSINKTSAVAGADFAAKILPIGDGTNILPHAIAVNINGQDVGTDKYTYVATGTDAGNFTIPAANLTGDVIITANAEKTMDSIGDYAYLYASGTQVDFTIKGAFLPGYYIFNAVYGENSSTLSRYYRIGGSGEYVRSSLPFIEIKNSTTSLDLSFRSTNPINDYVSASIVRVVSDNNHDARYNLKNDYNGKCVAFKYALPFKNHSPNIKATPMIIDGAEYLSEAPERLKKLIPNPTIYSSTGNEVKLIKKTGISFSCYTSDTEDAIRGDDYYFFLCYFAPGKIPSSGAELEISSIVKPGVIELENQDVSHQIFVKCSTNPNTPYFAYNDYALPVENVYNADNFAQVENLSNRFIAESSNTLVKYSLKQDAKLSNCNVFLHDATVTDGLVNLASYANEEIVFGSSTATGQVAPMSSYSIEDTNRYTHLIKVNSKNPIIKDGAAISVSATETSTSGFKSTLPLEFEEMISYGEDHYYAPARIYDSNASTRIEGNHLLLPAGSTVSKVDFNNALMSFNDKVSSTDTAKFISCKSLNVTTTGTDGATFSNVSNLNYNNAFVGIPYQCKVNINTSQYIDIPQDQVSKRIIVTAGDTLCTFNYDISTHILSFVPISDNDINILIIAEHQGPIVELSSEMCEIVTFDGNYARISEINTTTEVLIYPKDGYQLKKDIPVSLDPIIFKATHTTPMAQYEILPYHVSIPVTNNDLKTPILLIYRPLLHERSTFSMSAASVNTCFEAIK